MINTVALSDADASVPLKTQWMDKRVINWAAQGKVLYVVPLGMKAATRERIQRLTGNVWPIGLKIMES